MLVQPKPAEIAMKRKPKSMPAKTAPKQPVEYLVNPECITAIATLTEQMRSVKGTQEKVVLSIWGNDHPGIKEITENNAKDISKILVAIDSVTKIQSDAATVRTQENQARAIETAIRQQETETRKLETTARLEETKIRQTETLARRSDNVKVWAAIGGAVLIGIFSIITTILSNQDLMAQILKLASAK